MRNFLKSKKKSFKTSKTEIKYYRFPTLYAVLHPPPLFFHTHTHTTSSTSQLYFLKYYAYFVCMYTYTHMKASSFF